MARFAVIDNATGAVIRQGFSDFSADLLAGQSLVDVNDDAVRPSGVDFKYCKVVSGEFVEMSAPEKAAVDAALARRLVQRKTANAEVIVSTGQADTNNGWTSILAVQSRPLVAGEYALTATFELSLTAPAAWTAGAGGGPNRIAQARLLLNGSEIATWINPFDAYHRVGLTVGNTLAQGATPAFDLQLRRFGTAPGSARIRRARLELSPVATPDTDE